MNRPTIVCLCGSTKFIEALRKLIITLFLLTLTACATAPEPARQEAPINAGSAFQAMNYQLARLGIDVERMGDDRKTGYLVLSRSDAVTKTRELICRGRVVIPGRSRMIDFAADLKQMREVGLTRLEISGADSDKRIEIGIGQEGQCE